MKAEGWDVKHIRRLKKRLLLQQNIVMLFIVIFFSIYAINGWPVAHFLVLCAVVLSGIGFFALLSLWKGEPQGTKMVRTIQAYEKDVKGTQRWRRKKWMESIFIFLFVSAIIAFLIFLNHDAIQQSQQGFPGDVIPLLGAWIGMNIGSFVRIKDLRE
ncbi:hypothetical protein [Halobacillus kuroshimensis]|uniref:hypothetical protein n=1 Tax=Halobacillus kuroshimensis TaxID=302481 RepID=UPI0012EC92F3|nr:hypothetical protein [Halobacillus kuroshimensis]